VKLHRREYSKRIRFEKGGFLYKISAIATSAKPGGRNISKVWWKE